MVREFRTPTHPWNIISADEDDPNLTKSGTWESVIDISAMGLSYIRSKTTDDYVELTWHGVAVWIWVILGKNCGKVDISIDGGTAKRVDLYSESTRKEIGWGAVNLPKADHKIRLTVTGLKNDNATDYYVQIDGFEVEADKGALQTRTIIEQTASMRLVEALGKGDRVTVYEGWPWAYWKGTGAIPDDRLLVYNLDASLSSRARLQPWYQTNFNTVEQSYGGGSIAPHAATVRWTYTVPANRIAKCTNAFVEIMRVTAPVAAGRVTNVIRFAAAPVSAIVQVKETTAAVGVQNRLNVGESSMLVALEAVNAVTQDLSNGGAYDYVSDATFIEFNT